MDNNTAEQLEELEALYSIYDTQFKQELEDNSYSIEVVPNVKLFLTLNSHYPSDSPPNFELMAPIFTSEQKQQVSSEFETIYEENQGTAVIFQWIEKLKEIASNCTDNNYRITPIETRKVEDSSSNLTNSFSYDITHGESIVDRKSVFQGHCATVKTTQDTKNFLKYLLENRKIAQATHNITAYRIKTEKNTMLQDCDDDGETHAGGRLLHLLQILNVENVMVVVSRWYGGTQLGADRFKHINNAARQVLLTANCINS